MGGAGGGVECVCVRGDGGWIIHDTAECRGLQWLPWEERERAAPGV